MSPAGTFQRPIFPKTGPAMAEMVKGGMMFFAYLQRERRDLLEFKSSEKWQDVHGWLRWGLRVKE
jgi:hypothetical protein